jgi:hypothetical protein
MSIAQQRAPKVSEKKFATGYITGCKNGKTGEEIAETLGMHYDSFKTRASQFRAKYAKMNPPIDVGTPAGGISGLSKEERAKQNLDFVQSLLADADSVDSELETEQDSE